jgi:hypothetical protein
MKYPTISIDKAEFRLKDIQGMDYSDVAFSNKFIITIYIDGKDHAWGGFTKKEIDNMMQIWQKYNKNIGG